MQKGVLAAVVMSVGLANSAAAAPIVWSSNGHSYEYFADALTWDEALAAAEGLGGYLATITSAAENDFIYNSVTNQQAWVGGSDQQTEGVWKWVTGPETGDIFFGTGAPSGAYSNWASGEPNDFINGEDYLVFAWSGNNWNDYGPPNFPTATLGYIVEWGGEDGDGQDGDPSVPEPATLMLLGLGGAVVAARRRRQR